jgi:predicted acyltransferase
MMAGDIQQSRLASLDAARGFDMFFIMGGEGLVVSIAALLGFPEFHASFGHVPWDGLNFMDTVFPTFLFLAGVTFPFSAAKSRERGATDLQIGLKALRRCALLILLGLIHDGPLLRFDFAHLRVWSVLGRIGIAWFGGNLFIVASACCITVFLLELVV